MDSLSSANTQFCLDLFRKLNEVNPGGNVFISPLSITAALAMVYLGAKGQTATQMAKKYSMHLNTQTHQHFSFRDGFSTSESLCIFNKNLLNKTFVDFSKRTQITPVHLNKCITFRKKSIKNNQFLYVKKKCFLLKLHLFQQKTNCFSQCTMIASLSEGTVSLQVPRRSWDTNTTIQNPFDRLRAESKRTGSIVCTHVGARLEVSTSTHHGRIHSTTVPHQSLSAHTLLPEDISDGSTGLEKLEKELTLEKMQEWTKRENMDTGTDILVHLPKFKLQDDYELSSALAGLGMVDVFDSSGADLSGMNGGPGLSLSAVVHKSFIEVNEEGTEAAAATAGIVAFCMLREERFTADHPFLFFIRHNKSNSILFFGRFSSP
uniref:Serpin peptidase inhibitor, clade B (ovalbumin), member 1 n=1 Tax=Lepisosteus oculatus TaxID=7918 RepID=W5N5R1_LEPOC